MKKDKDNSKIIAILLATLAIVVIIVSFTIKKTEEQKEELTILKNPSQFFTVNSCIYRVTTYISKKETKNLLKVLSQSYRKKNKINQNNVLDVFPKIEVDSTFVSKKMYYQEINKHVKKYYVQGIIKPNIIHDYTKVEIEEYENVYYIVTLDSKNQLFSIEPYDGKIFMDGDKNE